MKALTLTQPWASLVAVDAKRVETRSWSTSYRGPLAIHAAKAMPKYAKEFAINAPAANILEWNGVELGAKFDEIPRGAVVAIAELVDVLPILDAGDKFGSRRRFVTSDGQRVHVWDVRCGVPIEDHDVNLGEYEAAFGFYESRRFAWLLGSVIHVMPYVQCRGELGIWECEAVQLA